MEKLQIVWLGADLERVAFIQDFRRDALPRLAAIHPVERVKVCLSKEVIPWAKVIPFARDPIAVVSIWAERGTVDVRPWLEALRIDEKVASVYQVAESTPVAYTRHWDDLCDTPGAGLLTLFRRRPDLDQPTFLRRWHEGHTPLALRVHPLWSYHRNLVQKVLMPEFSPWDAIVEEHFERDMDLLDPRRFFGGALAMVPNMLRIAADVRRFIHLPSLQAHLVDEIWVRS